MKKIMRRKFWLRFVLLPAFFSAALMPGGGSRADAASVLRDMSRDMPHDMILDMTLEEKVGQLFIIRPDQLDATLSCETVHSSSAPGSGKLTDAMRETLRQYPAGGFALFKKNIRSPEQLRRFTAELRGACPVKPLMAIDEEGGMIARIANAKDKAGKYLFDVPRFESMEALGKTGDVRSARDAASAIGKYLGEYGFNMDFAPDADVNTNPDNIVIGNRAFGSDPELVARMAGGYLDGLHERGIAGSVKHFPGHGDTTADPHTGYVAIEKTWDELLKRELIPFVANLDKADSVMTAHITLKNVTTDGLPATLSKELVTGKLRGELGYGGVIVTDAMMMGAIVQSYPSGEAAVMALEAGNDILLLPWDYREAFNGVLAAVREGRISEARLDESVRRILNLKRGLR